MRLVERFGADIAFVVMAVAMWAPRCPPPPVCVGSDGLPCPPPPPSAEPKPSPSPSPSSSALRGRNAFFMEDAMLNLKPDLAAAALLGLACLGCQTIIIDPDQAIAGPTSPTPSASPGTTPGCEAAVRSVRVNPFGYTCAEGVDEPSNSSGLLPLGCTAHVTATPKDQAGRDVPDTVHGPISPWSVAFGASHVEATPDPEQPFNVNVRAVSVGEFRLEASVCNVPGAWNGRVISQ